MFTFMFSIFSKHIYSKKTGELANPAHRASQGELKYWAIKSGLRWTSRAFANTRINEKIHDFQIFSTKMNRNQNFNRFKYLFL